MLTKNENDQSTPAKQSSSPDKATNARQVESPLPGFANLNAVLRHRVENQAERIALTFTGGSEVPAKYRYQDLHETASTIAAALTERNLAGSRALLLFNPGYDYVATFFGCLMAGVIAVPAYPPMTNRDWPRLLNIVDDCAAKLVMTTSSLLQPIRTWLGARGDQSIDCLAVDGLESRAADLAAIRAVGKDINQQSIAFLQYTSGSTGNPKGVMVTHGNLLHNCSGIMASMHVDAESIGVSWLPPYHDMGLIGGILTPILGGFPIHLMSPMTFLKNPMVWLRTISRARATLSGGPNFGYEYCVRRVSDSDVRTLDLSSWRVAANGAEPINSATLKLFSQHFAAAGFSPKTMSPCYGLAEATLMVAGKADEDEPRTIEVDAFALAHNVYRAPIDEKNRMVLVSNGKAISDTRIHIVNPSTRQAAEAGEIGEIWVQGPGIAAGYWQRPDATEATFEAYFKNAQRDVIGPCMRTGDMGFMHEGELVITGRAKEIVIIRGRNYYPQDIEWIVQDQHAALPRGNGAAFSVNSDEGEVLVMVQEVARAAKNLLQEEGALQKLVQSINQALSEQLGIQLHTLVLIEGGSLLKTSSGKIQRVGIRQSFIDGTLSVLKSWQRQTVQQVVHPASSSSTTQSENMDFLQTDFALTQLLAQWVSESLGVNAADIDIDLPFSALGLDSVQGVEIAARLEKHLGRDLPPTLLFRHPTINDLVAFINSDKNRTQTDEHTDLDDLDVLSHEDLINRLKSELQNSEVQE